MSLDSGTTVGELGASPPNEVQDPQIFLDRGNLVPVKEGDEATSYGLEDWEGDPPMYHDLGFASYLNFDVQEWTSRIKKYKYAVVTQAERIKKLKPQVESLRKQLETHEGDFEELDVAIEQATDDRDRLLTATAAEKKRRNELLQEINSLKQHRDMIRKNIGMVRAETAGCIDRIGYLKEEVDGNRERHERALGEKERLNLEREWFFRERLLLEETTNQESDDIATILDYVEKLRHTMHRAWKEAKETDVLGHLRATKLTPADEAWYTARRRKFARSTVSRVSSGLSTRGIQHRSSYIRKDS